MTFKAWKMEEAERCGVTENAIQMRLIRGRYPTLKLCRINARVIVVENRTCPLVPRRAPLRLFGVLTATIGIRIAMNQLTRQMIESTVNGMIWRNPA